MKTKTIWAIVGILALVLVAGASSVLAANGTHPTKVTNGAGAPGAGTGDDGNETGEHNTNETGGDDTNDTYDHEFDGEEEGGP